MINKVMYKIAIVTDWLVTVGGAEKVLEQLLQCYPEADVYSLVDFLSNADRGIIHNKKVTTSFIQKLPFAKTKYRAYLPLMTLAVEQFDLSKYDLVISSSHSVAKGIITGPDQVHICYCHTPMRYAWDLQHQYLKGSGLTTGIKSWIIRLILHKIRIWDLRTSNGVDFFIANSKYIARRIWKVYRREADVIYPPVATAINDLECKREGFYVTVSRMVVYKKIDIIVEAFIKNPNRKLVVIGSGAMLKNIMYQARNADNIQVLGYQSDAVLIDYLHRAKAFVFAAEEDFGILPVEAQSYGAPVIAYGKGGVTESVIVDGDNKTGVFFDEQTAESLNLALDRFEQNNFIPKDCISNAKLFTPEIFRNKITNYINEKMTNEK